MPVGGEYFKIAIWNKNSKKKITCTDASAIRYINPPNFEVKTAARTRQVDYEKLEHHVHITMQTYVFVNEVIIRYKIEFELKFLNKT